jgi:hypothetical protein
MSDPHADAAAEPSAEPDKPVFTKDAQPDLPLELRKEKAGWTRNRIGIWVVVGGLALFMIIDGLVGILTKAR